MPLELLTLQFRHNGDAATLPLRIALGATPLALPEGRAGNTDPSLSPVACLQAAPGAARTVLATFSRSDRSVASFQVMASSANGEVNLLGVIAATTVNFPPQQDTVTVALPFSGSSLSQVALHTDSFAWQTKLPA